MDGGNTIHGFLEAGLLQEITIARIPILIGEGIPLFGRVDHDVRMELLESRAYPTGVVQSRYRIVAA